MSIKERRNPYDDSRVDNPPIFESHSAAPVQRPVAWDERCVLGHCGSPTGCELSNRCRADNTTPQPQQAEKQEPWVWQQAPIKTQWGHDMVVADLAIDKDHTVSVYCERDQTARVEAMFKGKNT